jgi:hypothetical protein
MLTLTLTLALPLDEHDRAIPDLRTAPGLRHSARTLHCSVAHCGVCAVRRTGTTAAKRQKDARAAHATEVSALKKAQAQVVGSLEGQLAALEETYRKEATAPTVPFLHRIQCPVTTDRVALEEMYRRATAADGSVHSGTLLTVVHARTVCTAGERPRRHMRLASLRRTSSRGT